ncbi:fumarylacetoacetate hydrolase family protein [Burkholderiaceae bacterium FT117]|uniref:2-keto-4-pentenoate hydratase n=1 Tax=Zeimonas sediminis TaxID=2944268 RepID=UPI002343094C|nr:fumarylacetoacetate hydrolase family protein [Zeimonas sediminis]MCM5570420.1 fumarylacetoacetate hydrolase family protein [Zeimonas sediminis]
MTITTNPTAAGAASLVRQRLDLHPILEVPDAPRDLRSGYALQAEANRLLERAGMGPRVGHKIGCTTPVMQAFLGIPSPCAGEVFGKTVMRSGARIPAKGFVRVGVECEIAVRLGRDLPARSTAWDRETVADAVEGAMAAIEIVDDRYADYKSLGVPLLVADDFFNAGCVLGPLRRNWRSLDLAALQGRMSINGTEVGRGRGELVMGHPLNALAWLANARIEHSLPPLRKGEFVLLGSVVATQWLKAGDRVETEVEGLGRLSLAID